MEVYKKEKQERRLPLLGVRVIVSVREALNQNPETRRKSYADRQRRWLLHHAGRGAKSAGEDRLRWSDSQGCQAVLSGGNHDRSTGRAPATLWSPGSHTVEILQDDSYATVLVRCYAAGKLHDVPVKVLGPVYWRNAGCDLPLQVVVIKPLGYRRRKGGRLMYRKPAFLVCTDPTLDLQQLVQAYLYTLGD